MSESMNTLARVYKLRRKKKEGYVKLLFENKNSSCKLAI